MTKRAGTRNSGSTAKLLELSKAKASVMPQSYDVAVVPVNGNRIAIPQSLLQSRLKSLMVVSDDEFANAVHACVGRGVITITELEDIIHKENRQTRNYIDGVTPFKVSQYRAIANEVFDRGDASLTRYFIPDGWMLVQSPTGKVNGCMVDEMIEGVHCIDRGRDLFDRHHLDEAERFADKVIAVGHRMKKEVSERRKQGR